MRTSVPGVSALWNCMCNVEIDDVVNLTTNHPGGGGFIEPFFVEGVSYDVKPMKNDFVAIVATLSVSPLAYFTDTAMFPPDPHG